jgi:hypothetical protein
VSFDGVVQQGEEVVDGRPPQLVLRFEVVVDLRLVGSGGGGDRPGRRALEPVRGELGQGGVQQCLARRRGASLPTGSCVGRSRGGGGHLAILYHSI